MSFSLEQLGERLRQLRLSRGLSHRETGIARSSWSKIENGRSDPSVGYVERLCAVLGIGLNRLLAPEIEFSAMLALEDRFVLQVRPFLKLLNGGQRKLILKTLEAAPKQIVNHGGRKSANTEHRTLNVSGNSTRGRDLSTVSRTLVTQCLPLAVSQRTNQAAHR